jgi:antitoxin ParD1/3/4
MNVSLTPEIEAFVRRKVQEGRYNNASELVRHALRRLEDEEREYEAKLAALKAEIQIGIDQLDRGEYSTRSMAEIRQEALRRHRSR